jgi:hypothetical protein
MTVAKPSRNVFVVRLYVEQCFKASNSALGEEFEITVTIPETEDTVSSFGKKIQREDPNIVEKTESNRHSSNSGFPCVPVPLRKWEIRISPEFPRAGNLMEKGIPCQLEFSFLVELRLMEPTKPQICAYCLKSEPSPAMYNYQGRTLCDDCCWEFVELGGF